ncbi:uncharacterized protein [Ambystoma mexicanum]|uniref:uncharacterized protein n=1 Tax=Ambystoma mexicanum TaxID=8296 RepID=UPI0037E8E1BC
MARAPCTSALLLVVGALVTPAYFLPDPCGMPDISPGNGSFSLRAARLGYAANTTYNVTVLGTENFTAVQLEALDRAKGSSVGQWATWSGIVTCSNGSIFWNATAQSISIVWVSPQNSSSVNIRAYVTKGNATYLITLELKQDPTISPNSSTNSLPPTNAVTYPIMDSTTNAASTKATVVSTSPATSTNTVKPMNATVTTNTVWSSSSLATERKNGTETHGNTSTTTAASATKAVPSNSTAHLELSTSPATSTNTVKPMNATVTTNAVWSSSSMATEKQIGAENPGKTSTTTATSASEAVPSNTASNLDENAYVSIAVITPIKSTKDHGGPQKSSSESRKYACVILLAATQCAYLLFVSNRLAW